MPLFQDDTLFLSSDAEGNNTHSQTPVFGTMGNVNHYTANHDNAPTNFQVRSTGI